ncbi:LuxR C-terminal-related transcriptional regulator [Streptomyces pinistramenti]|uniref:LuxR C-terminal-related transcriptional regulator n=1 Tax=Streptomyces pinistramenti TaxID=2884812 RepID=UPI001D08457C|nr:response regulator transcription factor [Streptomyces pinistramenti]MCB5911923.1 response regulator transcription factor [Streptomyces pinistramenti]
MTICTASHTLKRDKGEVKRIIVFDQNELSRAGFTSLINGESNLVATEADHRTTELSSVIRHLRPDVIVVAATDRILDELRGLTAAAATLPIVAFADRWNLESAVGALRLGARGLGEKSGSRSMITTAIHAVAAGGTYLAPSVADRVIGAALDQAVVPDTAVLAKLATLTDRESRVLNLLADGLATADIAESLAVSSATVKSHISHMLRKLGLRDRAQAVAFAYRSGLASRDACPSAA